MRSYDIPNRDVEIFEDQQLGQGGFGTVYRGRWSGRDVAIKVLVCSLQGNVADDFSRELKMMRKLSSPQVIQTFGGIVTGPTQAIVMELMPQGNLYSLLRQQKPEALPWSTKCRIALDMAYGVKYLHRIKILHRDLKS